MVGQGDCGSGIVIKRKEDNATVLVGVYCGKTQVPIVCNGSHSEECAVSASDFREWITETVRREEEEKKAASGECVLLATLPPLLALASICIHMAKEAEVLLATLSPLLALASICIHMAKVAEVVLATLLLVLASISASMAIKKLRSF